MLRHTLPCLLLFASAGAQAQVPTPPSLNPPTQAPAPVPTLRASSRLVIVDVVVSDKAGKPVRGLKQSDFTLLEKGEPQTLAHFEEHSFTPAAPPRLGPVPHLDPGVFTNYSPAPAEGALNILLLDSLNTPLESQAYVRDQILKYLKSARPGSRMAIFGLNQRLHLLQGFTSDPELLRTVLNSRKGLAGASPLMDNPVSGDTVGIEMPSDSMAEMLGNDPGAATIVANMQQFEAQQAAFQITLRVGYTLDALNLLGRYLSGLPGRKNLIWFSGSFPLNILPDGDLQQPFMNVASFEDEFRETTNLLARSQVAVYPVDARGLMVNPMMSASNSGAKYARNPQAFGKDQAKFFNQTADEHSTMRLMAEQTGGKAFVNTNGLKEAVDSAVEAGSNYYTLSYTPSNRDWRGDFRKIQVKLAEQGYSLSYRRGYYANDPDASPHKGIATTAAAATGSTAAPNPAAPNPAAPTASSKDALHAAMIFGGPDPVQIIFTAAVLPTTGEPETAPVPDNHLAPNVEGPYKRYTVGLTVTPRGLFTVPQPNGARHLHVEFLTFVYSEDGAVVNTLVHSISGDISDAGYKDLLKNGLQVREDISVPLKGQYFLRVGIYDPANDHVGALQVPVDRVAKMKPLSAILAGQQAAPAAAPAASGPKQ